MFRSCMFYSMIVVFLFATNSANAQYGVIWDSWQPHVNGVLGTEFCPNDTLNSKSTITINNDSGGPVDIRIRSWIDGGSLNDSGIFTMTGTSLVYPVNRSLTASSTKHSIKCTVTFYQNGTRIFGPNQIHNYGEKEGCGGVE